MPRSPSPLPPMRCGLDGLLRAPTVFSTPAAREAGVSAARLRRGDVVSLGWGLWGLRDVEPDPMDHVRALQDLHPEGVFSHVTAARVLGLWLTGPLAADRSVHIATPRGHGTASRRAGIRSHRLRADAPVRIVDGVRVTAPGWIFVDLAAQAGPLEHLVALGDSMVRTAPTEARRRRLPPGVTDVAELRAAVEERGRVRGIRAAREALELVRPGADSPQESRLRARLVLDGFPEPAVNPCVRLATGQRLRVDLVWAEAKVAVEYDGDQHRTDRRQWREDRERDAALRAEGWEVIRVTADVFRPGHWELFVRQLRGLVAARTPPGRVPPSWI
ncbi:DUF559 domain-containing protein [Micrococcus luteus]|uniref:DUF559 domain-containing protein n=1 Tax=Micrococcus luteus TaxID=1270 RepID=UPI00080DB2F1|nr:DUF559 domain-containing protein [Micrococcus luteus]